MKKITAIFLMVALILTFSSVMLNAAGNGIAKTQCGSGGSTESCRGYPCVPVNNYTQECWGQCSYQDGTKQTCGAGEGMCTVSICSE